MPRTPRARGSVTGFAPVVPTDGRSTREPAPTNGRAACRENNGMHLVDWIGQVPSSGEKSPSGERRPPSLRQSSIKVGAQTAAKPAPFSVGHRCGERGAKGRLERVKGFEPSTPTLARLCCREHNEESCPRLAPAGWMWCRRPDLNRGLTDYESAAPAAHHQIEDAVWGRALGSMKPANASHLASRFTGWRSSADAARSFAEHDHDLRRDGRAAGLSRPASEQALAPNRRLPHLQAAAANLSGCRPALKPAV
jgi:hypothetical protein